MCDVRRRPRRRKAFTLIELLVVMVLILAIAALGIGYVVFGQDNQHSLTGANAVTGALLNAKQRARRDGLPTGIRILFGTGKDKNGNPVAAFAGQIELIQQPEDYNSGQCLGPVAGSNNQQLDFSGVDFQGGAKYIGEIDESTVQAGDYFVVAGVPTPHRINTVLLDATNNNAPSIKLDSPVTILPGQAYNIVRAPRRLPSEDIVQLPPSIVVDDSTVGGVELCQNLPRRNLIDMNNPSPGQLVSEIVFAPSGAVVGQGTGADKVLLWVRDPSQATPTSGAPLLVSVQIRTGLISTFPVAPWNGGAITPNNDPFAFAKDGRASGI